MINDSSPERRNLMVLSISIILYYAAGGSITDPVVKFPMVNVEFSRPEILGIAVWVALFWFAFRYWQVTRDSTIHEFNSIFLKQLNKNRYIQNKLYDDNYANKEEFANTDDKTLKFYEIVKLARLKDGRLYFVLKIYQIPEALQKKYPTVDDLEFVTIEGVALVHKHPKYFLNKTMILSFILDTGLIVKYVPYILFCFAFHVGSDDILKMLY